MAEKPAVPAATKKVDVDAVLDAFLARDREAALAVSGFAESANQDLQRRMSRLLKKPDNETPDQAEARVRGFVKAYRTARRTEHESFPSLAHQWVFEHARNEGLREVAPMLLADAALIRGIPSKYWLNLIENLVASPDFVPTQHWLVVGARACGLLPGHVAVQLQVMEKLGNVTTANAVVTCKPFLERLLPDVRMDLLRRAFMVCELPPRWVDFARSVGLRDDEIAELVTARCAYILWKLNSLLSRSTEDISFLRILRKPAGSDASPYRSVLDDRQLTLVVKAVRRGIPARTTEEHAELRNLCLGTSERRFGRH